MTRYLPSIKHYSWIMLVCVLVAVIAGLLILRAIPPAYSASSTLMVQASSAATGAPSLTVDPTRAIAEANVYAAEVPSRDAMTLVSKLYPELARRGYSTFTLMHIVTATPDTNAGAITIQASAKTPRDAVMVANDVASSFVVYVTQQMQGQLDTLRGNLQTQIDSFQKSKAALEKTILAFHPSSTTTTTSGTSGTNTPGSPGSAGSNSSSTTTTTTTTSNSSIAVYTTDLASLNQTIASLESQLAMLPTTAVGNVAVIQFATPADVSPSPKTLLIVAATVLVSLILGALLIALMIYLDRRLLGENEVKEKLGLPYLGGISTHMTLAAAPASPGAIPAQESANIFTSLLLTNISVDKLRDHIGSVILVTSSQEAEGKTTVACALAGSIVRSGGTVAIIDANLSRPATHLALRVKPAGLGLSGLLTAEGPTEEALLQVGDTPGLWMMPTGSAVETPTLLLQERLPEILEQLSRKVDVVIIDSPAVLNSADSVQLASMADYVALVVDGRHSKLEPIEYATDLLTSMSSTPVGIVLNRLPAKRRIRYYASGPGRHRPIPARLSALTSGEQPVPVQIADGSSARWRDSSDPSKSSAIASGSATMVAADD